MVTRDEARELVEAVGKELAALPYAELSRFTDVDEDDSRICRDHRVAGASVSTWARIEKIEGKRERILVEVFVHADGMDRWWWRPCYYVEVYPSGRIDRFDRFGWQEVVLGLFVIAGICGAVLFVLEIVT